MCFPYSLVHLVDRDSLCFRQEEFGKNAHYNNDDCKEEEDHRLHATQHGEESLSDDEGEQHVHANCDEETSSSGFQWEDFTRNQPTQGTP